MASAISFKTVMLIIVGAVILTAATLWLQDGRSLAG